MTVRVCAGVWNNISLPLLRSGRRVDVFMAVVVLGLNVGTIFRSHLCILGDPGAVSRVDKMFVVKVYCKIDLTVNFHHEHFIDPTNCPWVSEDAICVEVPVILCLSAE